MRKAATLGKQVGSPIAVELPPSNVPPVNLGLREVALDFADAERAPATPLHERPNTLPEVAVLNEVPWVPNLIPPPANQPTPQTDNSSI
eukprot:284016-Alexandrium_andersonii.AAC.1